MPLEPQQQDIPINLFADRLRRQRIADFQCIKRQQLPKQFVDEQARDLIEPGDPSDLTVDAQTQKCLHCDCDASYSVNIRPSQEFHGGQFLLFGVGIALQP
jgi:hypothetical protein